MTQFGFLTADERIEGEWRKARCRRGAFVAIDERQEWRLLRDRRGGGAGCPACARTFAPAGSTVGADLWPVQRLGTLPIFDLTGAYGDRIGLPNVDRNKLMAAMEEHPEWSDRRCFEVFFGPTGKRRPARASSAAPIRPRRGAVA
jgi:hypothetical protein